MKGIFSRAIVYAIILYMISTLMQSVYIGGIGAAFLGGIILSVLNVLVKPFLQLISLPITVMTLGFFSLIVNGIVFGLAAFLTPQFSVGGLGSATLAALLFTIFNVFLNGALKEEE